MNGLIGWRKFILAFLVLAMIAVLCAVGKLDGLNTVNGFVWTFAAYMGGNVGEHVAEKKK